MYGIHKVPFVWINFESDEGIELNTSNSFEIIEAIIKYLKEEKIIMPSLGWGNDSCKKPLFDTKGTTFVSL